MESRGTKVSKSMVRALSKAAASSSSSARDDVPVLRDGVALDLVLLGDGLAGAPVDVAERGCGRRCAC
jgi:hypothetical protein